MSSNKEHIVLLPFMAHGHLIPFLSLAKQLQKTTNFTVTIANTPQNIHYLRSSIQSSINCKIQLIELPFCSTDYGLPPNSENCDKLSSEDMGKLVAATVDLKNPFEKAVSDIIINEGRPPICIISDWFFGWINEIAKSLGSLNLTFSTSSAYGTLASISVCQNLPHFYTKSDDFHVPGFPEWFRFHITQLDEFVRTADGNDSWSKFMQPMISLALQSFGLICNTIEEIEPLGLDLLRNYVKIPVWSIGFNDSLVSDSNTISQRSGKEFGISKEKCMEFLDFHCPNSVLYISFGSQYSISPSQMMEFAIGLEKSEKPFIWVIKPPTGFNREAEFNSEWLPDGFEERIRMKKQGLVVKNWAPQLEILSHKSTGAFLSHCGWNSVLESLSEGVPIIGWPLAAEQAYNSKLLVEEMGVGVELARGMESNVSWKEVKVMIELVMEKKGKGDDLRKKAMEIRELIRGSVKDEDEKKGSCVKAMNDFVKTLLAKTK